MYKNKIPQKMRIQNSSIRCSKQIKELLEKSSLNQILYKKGKPSRDEDQIVGSCKVLQPVPGIDLPLLSVQAWVEMLVIYKIQNSFYVYWFQLENP